MNSRQRIQAALDHLQPDRTPIFEYVLLSPLADVLLGHPYAGDPDSWDLLVSEVGWEKAVYRNAGDRLELARVLGHDMIYATPVPPPPDLEVTSPPQASLPADPVEALRIRNMQTRNQPFLNADTLLIYQVLKEEMPKMNLDIPIMAPAYFHGVWTDIDLMQTMLLDPPTAYEHFSLATQRALAYIDRYIELDIEMIGVGGDFAGTRPIISPKAYRTFIVPEVRTCARRLHAAGKYAVNASDGDLWLVIDDFLIGCEVDGYLEIDFFAGMDLRRLKQEYGNRITFFGNLDCGNLLSFGTPEQIRRHTFDCLDAGMGNGGHILCASNAITASISLQNYLAMVNAYREYFGLPAIMSKDVLK